MFKNFFRNSCRVGDNVEKHGRARQATDDNVALVDFTLGT